MAKVHNITVVIAFLFVVIMIIIIIHPVNFVGQDIEQVYHSNEGLIWFLGIIIGCAIMLMTYLNGVFQNEIKTCNRQNMALNEIIRTQNEKIIKNQEDYIKSLDRLTEKINNNYSQDNEVIRKVDELSLSVNKITDKIEKHEREIARLKGAKKTK